MIPRPASFQAEGDYKDRWRVVVQRIVNNEVVAEKEEYLKDLWFYMEEPQKSLAHMAHRALLYMKRVWPDKLESVR
jgi:hypothetical protein